MAELWYKLHTTSMLRSCTPSVRKSDVSVNWYFTLMGAIIVYHVTPPHGRSKPDDCERTVTAALPTAASAGFISGELGSIAALDAFSTVYELPLTCFENGQTDRQTDIRTRTITIPRYSPREVIKELLRNKANTSIME